MTRSSVREPPLGEVRLARMAPFGGALPMQTITRASLALALTAAVYGPTPRASATPFGPATFSPTATTSPARSSTVTDGLEAELQRQLEGSRRPEGSGERGGTAGGEARGRGDERSAVRDPGRGSAASRGLSTAFNPAISANGAVLAGVGTEAVAADPERGDLPSGLHLQEVEVQLSAIVDPYLRADLVLAASEDEIGFEEAFLSTLDLPGVTLRAGQMKAAFGRHNALHTHAFPFITAPLPWRALLGPEGLVDPGVSAEVLLPLPFFAELTVQAQRGTWAPLVGTSDKDDRDLGYLGRLRTLFDLSDSATVEVGASYAGGANGFGGATHLGGADLTVKWRPVDRARELGLEWTTEGLYVVREGADPAETELGGAYTSLRAQLAARWWLQGRAAVLAAAPAPEGRPTWRGEGLVAFVPSEFSSLRAQYAYETHADLARHELFLQAVFSIGSHPAHAY